jgi:hypothetical protein
LQSLILTVTPSCFNAPMKKNAQTRPVRETLKSSDQIRREELLEGISWPHTAIEFEIMVEELCEDLLWGGSVTPDYSSAD